MPDKVQINYNNQSYFLQQNSVGKFQYTFNQPQKDVSFSLSADNITSKQYNLEVLNTPTLVSFDMVLDYPQHTNKRDETLKGLGNAIIPEGTKVIWSVSTKKTTEVNIYSKDTLRFNSDKTGIFKASKRLYKNYKYSINTSNTFFKRL